MARRVGIGVTLEFDALSRKTGHESDTTYRGLGQPTKSM